MDVNSILNSFMGSGNAGLKRVLGSDDRTFGQGMVGGAAAGGLATMLMSSKKARKLAGKTLAYGGVLAAGGLAYKVWKDRQQVSAKSSPRTMTNQPPTLPNPPTGTIFDLNTEPENPDEDMRLVLIRAMISAAKADGHIDTDERTTIEEQIRSLQIGQDEQRYLVTQLKAPSDPIAIAKLAQSEEQALEIYAASLLAVDIDTQQERHYLDRLADALHLTDDLKHALESEAQAYQG